MDWCSWDLATGWNKKDCPWRVWWVKKPCPLGTVEAWRRREAGAGSGLRRSFLSPLPASFLLLLCCSFCFFLTLFCWHPLIIFICFIETIITYSHSPKSQRVLLEDTEPNSNLAWPLHTYPFCSLETGLSDSFSCWFWYFIFSISK